MLYITREYHFQLINIFFSCAYCTHIKMNEIIDIGEIAHCKYTTHTEYYEPVLEWLFSVERFSLSTFLFKSDLNLLSHLITYIFFSFFFYSPMRTIMSN